MSEPTERDKLLSYLKKVSADLFQARARLRNSSTDSAVTTGTEFACASSPMASLP